MYEWMTERSLSRYDCLLAVIPALLVFAALVSVLIPVGIDTALGVGSVPAFGTVAYALFHEPPT